MRWAPQTTSGMIGTSASSAIRAAPVLKAFNSKLRLIVGACVAVNGDGLGVPDQKVDGLHVLHLGLDHVAQAALALRRGQGRREEVDVAGVIDRHDGTADGRNVVQT